jgi:serine/threonine-protein kinase
MNIGDKLGHYAVVAKIGAGGMGEVYRATDTKLGRDVAIKVLPEALAADPQRMQRFQREAQVLASLNHPHIAAIYGLEESATRDSGAASSAPTVQVRALVMELVEGPTLAERIAHGPVPLEEALPIARQIAEALEYAHEHGIIHRDLKPANIKLTPDGAAKVLDFGLAKAMADDPASGLDLANSPTLSVAATKAGLILGTAAYMSPEQARGGQVDKRADVWAFGAVLYEMVSGRRLFDEATTTDTLAAVLKSDLNLVALPAATPTHLRRLLQRCLERDRKRRLRDIGEARIAIEDAIAHPEAPAPAAMGAVVPAPAPARRAILPWAVAAALALTAAWLGWRAISAPPAGALQPVRFTLTLPSSEHFTAMEDTNAVVAVSSDGTRVVYAARSGGTARLYLRALGELEAKPIPGTEGDPRNPFFSPDGKWVAFINNNKLQKVALDGGSPLELCHSSWAGGTWGRNGTIIYTKTYATGLWRIPAAGGTPEKLTEPSREAGELGHWWPQFLPGEKEVLFTAWSTPVAKARLMVLSLETGKQKVILEGGTYARYVPTGHILYMREEGLMAAPFDLDRLELAGTPVRVLEEAFVDKQDGLSPLSVSETGVLAYLPKSTLHRSNELVWVDRRGETRLLNLPKHRYEGPRLSPDGRMLALTIAEGGSQDVWVYDLARGGMIRIAAGPTSEFNPLWTRDGKRIIYQLERPQYDIFVRPADGTGTEQVLASNPYDKLHYSISPDGQWLAYTERHGESGDNLWILPVSGDGKPQPYLETPFGEDQPVFSPDGRWIAYKSNSSGREEVYVQAFPTPGERWQISTEGGANPVWSRKGDALFYRSGESVLSVKVRTGGKFEAEKPQVLFRGNFDYSFPGPNYDVSSDGRFLLARTPPESAPRTLVVVLNWFEELKRLAPTGKK